MQQTAIDLERLAHVLKLLGDKTRLTIVALLQQRECCVCELVEVFDTSQPSISQHLRKLRDAGLVKEERKGQWVYYSLNPKSDLYAVVEDVLKHAPKQQEKMKQIEVSNPTARCDC